VPEGDTIHAAARRVGAALVGKEIVSIETPQRRHAMDRWPARLAGRPVRSVDAHGKHLFVHFEGDLTLHSHLRMRGMWGVYQHGRRWSRAPHRAWLVIRTPEHESSTAPCSS
jgi:endonuclease VIII